MKYTNSFIRSYQIIIPVYVVSIHSTCDKGALIYRREISSKKWCIFYAKSILYMQHVSLYYIYIYIYTHIRVWTHEPYIDVKMMLHIPINCYYLLYMRTCWGSLRSYINEGSGYKAIYIKGTETSLPCLLSMFGGKISFDPNSSMRNSAFNEIKNGTSLINVAMLTTGPAQQIWGP